MTQELVGNHNFLKTKGFNRARIIGGVDAPADPIPEAWSDLHFLPVSLEQSLHLLRRIRSKIDRSPCPLEVMTATWPRGGEPPHL